MIDYKYLKDNGLYESHLRFMRAINEGYGYAPIEEADDDKEQSGDIPPMNQQQGDMPSNGGQMGDPSMGMDPAAAAAGGMPPMNGVQGQDNGNAQANAPMDGDASSNIDMPSTDDPMGMNNPMDGMQEEQEDEDVIDVDDITNAQEKTNDKVNSVGRDLGKVDGRIEKLINAVDKLETMFDKNNHDILDLKREFEKRNPTETERLNLRSLDSYPYNVRPSDYWEQKAKTSNYSAYADNNEPTTDEYVITNNDVDDFNEREIADSFTIDDDLNQNIRKIFGLA